MENRVAGLLKPRASDSRKGDNGRLLVIGGSIRYSGAPALVSFGALRTGTDIVYTLVPNSIAPTVASYSPDLIVWGYEGEYLNRSAMELVQELEPKTDALVIGNGLTAKKEALQEAGEILSAWEKPVVIDADLLGRVKTGSKLAIYTPHDGEFERISGKKPPIELNARAEAVKKEAGKLNGVVLLKGPVDVVSEGRQVFLNRTGNSAMAVGGTGDVLAGLAGGFLSQGKSPFDSARLAAYINGLAGDLAFKELGYSMRATDMLDFIRKAMMRISK